MTAAPRPLRRRAQPSPWRRLVKHRHDYLYVAPALIVMLIVIGYPIYYTVYLSFFSTPPQKSLDDKIFVGFGNYVQILTDPEFWHVTRNTFVWTIGSTLVAYIMGFGAALALDKAFFGRGFLRGVLLVPYVISAVAASYVWRWLYHSDVGIIGVTAMQWGLTDRPINFLDDIDSVMPSLIVVNIWKEFPFAMIMLLAGLQTVPEHLHRAAMVDGASVWQRFWHITFPHLRNVSVVTVLLLLVTNLNSFTIPYIMTGGGPAGASEIWITAVYQYAFGKIQFGLASAYSVILFIVMMGLGYFYVKALTAGDDWASHG